MESGQLQHDVGVVYDHVSRVLQHYLLDRATWRTQRAVSQHISGKGRRHI